MWEGDSPAIAFNLGVLAQHVEAQLLGEVQVEDQRRVVGRGIQPIWPEALQ